MPRRYVANAWVRRLRPWRGPLVVVCVLGAVYGATMHPGVSDGDSAQGSQGFALSEVLELGAKACNPDAKGILSAGHGILVSSPSASARAA